MSESTPRFALPFIIPGQAQKEFFHNEALTVVDTALHPAVEGSPQAAPPSAPIEGQCWIVAAGGTDSWSGRDQCLAMSVSAGWRFVAPVEGMSVWNKAAGYPMRWTGQAWTGGEVECSSVRIGGKQIVGARRPAVPSPSGGTVIDTQARSAVAAIIATLMSHGLIE